MGFPAMRRRSPLFLYSDCAPERGYFRQGAEGKVVVFLGREAGLGKPGDIGVSEGLFSD
jgi:hypothetical protein